ncbi:MAG TPA: NAD(P)H-dependent glycerol-3-phosphate dehydrogenase [Anaerohalosphaeraceae bacterium]|nr:NAD(P)H-dependent glycerol-3-phosphate dehydrogenase [Anaerohalosphaeraceae bacterium]HPB93951.1 NAD(P)H-dependent glycerol-3-phosphate dehydrogenase [Anaerohalosphaeraceae bacterium]HRT24536.1 NAD(P)H-dependent glycerol-3-phosphate dehydrogenase [Anaerohalosphaeraceae bacterium]HRU16065.1 NAD(P)H-dependent glycerol-3-phosphate dehydrogenase [Anaerohalosphaeraceae bacterium]
MFRQVTIIGDGAMGTVCGMLLCRNGIRTTMWGYNAAQLAQFEQARENSRFLPGYRFPDSLRLDSNDSTAMREAELLVSAVPCQFVRTVWQRLKPFVAAGIPIVSVTKGLENGTLFRPSEILADVLSGNHPYAALSGPTIADELMRELPATTTAASEDLLLAEAVQKTFSTPFFRVYTNSDLKGVELAGAMKNVIAIAAGCIDGIGAGDNAKAALITRGLAEIKRLGVALGARESTFAGLSGLGDLVTTCISPKGRNRTFGERIGRGMSAAEALAQTAGVVEGVSTCRSVVDLAIKVGVEMPISEAILAVLSDKMDVREAIAALMSRSLKAE